MQGQEIGSYVLESPLGRGGMGEVWLARHKSLGTRAAIKVLSVSSDEPTFHERFSREARAQARLTHPNIARVLDHVQKDGRWYLVTEYMSRGTLRDVLRENPGPVPVHQALAWARQALRGLEHAHGQGIVHRDVKPGNILLNDRGEAAVTDFGLAKIAGGDRLTQTGTAIGTPAYMSPEQLGGKSEVDHRTDLYSLGVVLYELLTGRVPFPMESASEVVRILVNEPPPLHEINPDLPPELGEIVLRALAKDPEARYIDAAEFAETLDAYETRNEGAAVVVPPPLPPLPHPDPAGDGKAEATIAPTLVTPPPEPAGERPVAVLSAEARATPPPAAAQGGTSAGAIAAMLAVLALMIGALAAGAAYFVWPTVKGALFQSEDPVAEVSAEDADADSREASDDGPAAPGDETASRDEARDFGTGAELESEASEPAIGPPPSGSDRTTRGTAVAWAVGNRVEEGEDQPGRVGSVEMGPEEADTEETLSEDAGLSRTFSPAPVESLPPPPMEPPPPAPRRIRLPPDPTVAVIALGDPLFARDFEQEVENRLLGLGVDVADEHNSTIISDVLRRWGDEVAVPELLPLLADAGFQALVLIQVEYVGSRELHYLGRYSEARQARLRVNAYLVSGDGALGPGWNEDVEYTELSANRKAETAMFEATNEMTDAIRYGWRQYRREVGG